ncbi:SDR family oxidoreductase [Williamsia maris]|uniref:NADP-dependent 3-hydroxy acid dehydrogenase YdfG n=1 Tax=Williamsia maris TaxID=72806 RepID=A0ABT1HC28_9NOCA|nr:SDR family NAD(P)-dependent oxidoreductase [Williamsia maris]MCP2175806.1 NADP-dependent 3-hydroxy acid dehydrogenase YdfG [Williamsia maris]
MEISGTVAVVTGGGAGIGAAIARAIVAHGGSVVVADLNADRVAAVADSINGSASSTVAASVAGDVSDPAVIDRIIATAEEQFGPVDLYVANAGTTAGMGLDSDDAAWQTALDVNVLAHVRAARALVPGWVERGRGYFLSTASAAGLLTQIGSVTYSVSKHAAVGFAEWLSVTYGDKGIAVSCLCPMGVNTELLNAGFETDRDGASVAASAVTSAGNVLEPDDVADVVIEALGDERFLILPHPEVLKMYQHKGSDYGRWISGMQRYQRALTES